MQPHRKITNRVSEDIQYEVLLVCGSVTGFQSDWESGAWYWDEVWQFMHARYPELAPTEEYPYQWEKDEEQRFGMETLWEIQRWQRSIERSIEI